MTIHRESTSGLTLCGKRIRWPWSSIRRLRMTTDDDKVTCDKCLQLIRLNWVRR